MSKLYNMDVYMPPWFEAPTHRVELAWTEHARKAAGNDRYGTMPEFRSIPLCQFEVIEIEVEDDRIVKYVVGSRFDSTRDAKLVLIPTASRWIVKTVWFNLSSDRHTTLRKERYATD